jgi:hypothetical protein
MDSASCYLQRLLSEDVGRVWSLKHGSRIGNRTPDNVQEVRLALIYQCHKLLDLMIAYIYNCVVTVHARKVT